MFWLSITDYTSKCNQSQLRNLKIKAFAWELVSWIWFKPGFDQDLMSGNNTIMFEIILFLYVN